MKFILKNNLVKYYLFLFLFSYSLILTRAINIPATDDQGRHFIRGDGYSDINTLSAVKYWKDYTYLSSSFRPIHQYNQPNDLSNIYGYTHYPAWPDLYTSIGYNLFSLTTETQARFWIIANSLFLVLLIYIFLKKFIPNPIHLFWSMAMILTSSYFVFWADNLHKHFHEYALFWLWSLLLYNYFKEKKYKLLFFFGPLLSLWTVHSSFESIVISVTLIVGTSLSFQEGLFKKLINPLTVYFGVLFVLAFFIHFWLNSLYFKSWSLAYSDLFGAYKERIGIGAADTSLSINEILKMPYYFLNRLERYFFVPGWLFLFFLYWHLKQLKVTNIFNYKFLIVLICAGISWYFFMPQHAYVHHFTAKHFVLVMAISSVFGIIKLYELYKNQHTYKKVLAGIGLLYLITMSITQIIYPVWWKYSLGYLFK